MTRPAEFREARTRGRRLSDSYFALSIIDKDQAHARLGLAIATRVFRTAVARNRIKRLVRESFRLNQNALPAVDIVVSARDGARNATASALRMSLAKFWKTLSAGADRCGIY